VTRFGRYPYLLANTRCKESSDERTASVNANPSGQTVDPEEVEKFAALAEDWWDPDGKFRPLHRMNPVRLRYILDRITAHFGRDPSGDQPLAGLTILDIGCGGGLLCEPLTRLGARVTGIDATHRSIAVAIQHAQDSGLKIDYRATTAENLAAQGENYDAVISMEVVEHVADVDAFLTACTSLVDPKGVLLLSTLNRTPKSWLFAIAAAEYLLRWLPRGTHDWRRFLRPSELAAGLRKQGMELEDLTGVAYNPLDDSWRLAPRDLEVNYMLTALKA